MRTVIANPYPPIQSGGPREKSGSRPFSTLPSHALALARQGDEELQVVYLDNQLEAATPTLVLIHGLFDSKATWISLCARLGSRCRTVAPDLLGFGHSSKPLLPDAPESYRYSAAMQVDCLEQVIGRLGLKEMILVGNSLGGGLALRLYLTREELAQRVRGLILIDTAAYPQELPGYVRELGGWLGNLLNTRPCRWFLFRTRLAEHLVYRTFRHAFHDPDRIPPDLVQEAVAVLRTPNILRAYQLAARNIVPADHTAFIEKFRQITCPTLILWGEQDRIVPPLFALRLKEDIPQAALHLFPNCGHAPHLEYPGETASLIEGWLQTHFQIAGKS